MLRSSSIVVALPCLIASWALAACGDEGGPSGIVREGDAPTIKNLVVDKKQIPVAKQTTVSGSFIFDDPDGDLESMMLEVISSGGTQQTSLKMQNMNLVTTAQLRFQIQLQPAEPGKLDFSVWVTDALGHASNKLSGSVAAK